MSVETSTNVWTHSRAQGVRLLALNALADIADDDGLCWPSVDYLAEKLRQADRYTRIVLKELKLAGELYVIPRTEWNSKLRWKSNAYIIMAGMTEERFVRACQHDPLNYSEEQARALFRAIPPDSIPTDIVFERRRWQGHDEPTIEAGDLKTQPRYDRIEVNPANSEADNSDHMIRGDNSDEENNPDDMIRVTQTIHGGNPDHMIRVTNADQPVYPDDMIRVNEGGDEVYPDHLIPSTLIKRSPNTSLDTIGGAGDSFSSLPASENATVLEAPTAGDFRELKVMLRGAMERSTYNDLIVPAGMSGETGPGLLILDVPTESQAERINHMLVRVIEEQLACVLGAPGTRVVARAGQERPAGQGAGGNRRQQGAKKPVSDRASPPVPDRAALAPDRAAVAPDRAAVAPAIRHDPRAEDVPY